MRRRDFLKAAAASGVALGGRRWTCPAWAGEPASQPAGSQPAGGNAARLPRRPYGAADVSLSIVGFPGFALNGLEPQEAQRWVAAAVERGVNYFDVAPSYGTAEERLGPALAPYRKDVFLACKTTERRREGAQAELKRSLERLQTDHFDLYQLHNLHDMAKDVDVAFAKGGAMEVLIEAKKSGQARHLGFSAHSVKCALTALERYEFDSILFPVNFGCFFEGNFGPQVVEAARKKGAAILAIKGLARCAWGKDENDPKRKRFSARCWYEPITDPAEADLSLRFTLGEPVVSAVPPADASLLPLAMDTAARYRPLSEKETAELRSLAAGLHPIFRQA